MYLLKVNPKQANNDCDLISWYFNNMRFKKKAVITTVTYSTTSQLTPLYFILVNVPPIQSEILLFFSSIHTFSLLYLFFVGGSMGRCVGTGTIENEMETSQSEKLHRHLLYLVISASVHLFRIRFVKESIIWIKQTGFISMAYWYVIHLEKRERNLDENVCTLCPFVI